jgi:phosphatidylserine/phosphatidylglycerophosphate/cardiolipin synthase-like enzyme
MHLLAQLRTLKRFIPAPKRTRFGEITSGNHIVFTVDGEETFKLIYNAISQAKSSIYIAGYDLDPSLNFVRDGGYSGSSIKHYNTSIGLNRPSRGSSSKSLSFVKGSVMIDSKSLKEDHDKPSLISGSAKSRQNPKLHISDTTTSKQRLKVRHSYKRLQELIVEKARKGTIVRIIVWQPRLPLRILPGADERGIDGRAEEVEVLNKLAIKYGIEQNLIVKIDNTSPTLSSAHHEKIIVIDNKIGFCGGFDLSRGKWDTSKHKYNDPRRDRDSEPWHDIHAMIKGPIVWDLAHHFNQ